MDLHHLQQLIAKYNTGTATPAEQQQVEQWYENLSANDGELNASQLAETKNEIHAHLDNYIARRNTSTNQKVVKLHPLRRYQTWVAAAIVLMVLGVAFFLYQHRDVPQQVAVKPTQLLKNDIAPGGNQAVLTLANGTQIVVMNKSNGKIAAQGNTQINKANDHLLVYDASAASQAPSAEVQYNTFSTPRGGKYDIVLPDGSRVSLNAQSSIKFPTAFTGTERRVELTGEAYFEVAKNKAMPFKVSSRGQTVEVLGTHFNINAYADEPAVKTTLLEGSVQVTKGSSVIKIAPGQQVVAKEGSDNIQVKTDADLAEVMAWRNDLFYFNEADINTIMRQVGRWYDVDVTYAGNIPVDHFNGKISRNVNASQVLRILELSGIHFKIEGRKIIVQ